MEVEVEVELSNDGKEEKEVSQRCHKGQQVSGSSFLSKELLDDNIG